MSDTEEPPEVSEEVRRLMQEKAEQLEHEAHKIGLHVTSMTLGAAVNATTGEPQALILMANFAIGDLAWNDRVQNPEADADKTEFAKIEHDFTIEKIEELRDRMRGGESDDTESET